MAQPSHPSTPCSPKSKHLFPPFKGQEIALVKFIDLVFLSSQFPRVSQKTGSRFLTTTTISSDVIAKPGAQEPSNTKTNDAPTIQDQIMQNIMATRHFMPHHLVLCGWGFPVKLGTSSNAFGPQLLLKLRAATPNYS